MVNCSLKGLLGVILVAVVTCSGSLWAENDYEYAKRLIEIEKQAPTFKTQDLVELLIEKLAASSNKDQKLEGKLIKAMLLRRQVAGASAERKKELLDEANQIYKEFLAEGKDHRLAKTCREAADEIQLEFVKVLVGTAKEDPAGGRAARQKAVEILNKIRLRQKKTAEETWPVLVKAYKAYQKVLEKMDMNAAIPPKILRDLGVGVEKVVVADQAYLQTWLMQIDAYPENSAEKKKHVVDLEKYCRKGRVETDILGEFELACAFYLYSLGRAHSYVLNEKKASDAWREALGMLPDEAAVEKGAVQTIRALQRMIIYDLVQMKMKAGEKNAEKYEDVIALVKQIKMSSSLRWILDEPAGKMMLINYSHALVRQPLSSAVEVADAIRALSEIVAGGPPWSYNASQTMAQVLVEAGPKKRPRLKAREWFDIARGFFYQGQRAFRRYTEHKQGGNQAAAEEEKANAVGQYEQAVSYYRRAIALSRNPQVTDVVTRLEIEPNAWFEMGLSYQKMDQLLEAAVAYHALRNAFEKSARERWMPKKFSSREQEKKVKALLAELDKEEGGDGLVKRGGKNILIALNKLPPTRPNKRLKARMLEDDSDPLANLTERDVDYDKGKLALGDAKELADQAANHLKRKRKGEAIKNQQQAFRLYKDAIKAFSEVKTSSPLYEVGLYQAGSASLLAQVLLVDKMKRSGAVKAESVPAQAKELGDKGLKAYKAYEDYVAKTHTPDPDVEARRIKLAKLVKLSRTTLIYNSGDMEGCIKACDDYLKTYADDLQDKADDPKLLTVAFNKFRALSKLAGEKSPPECDPYLVEAGKMLAPLRAKETYYRYALSNLSARYFNASVRSEKAQMGVAVVRKYDRKLADYMRRALNLKPEKERDLDDYGRLLGTLEKIEDFVGAADVAEEMLRLFDPEGKNCRLTDEELPTLLKRMHDVIRYADLQKMEACRKDHTVLIDHLYEDFRVAEMSPERRPAQDKFPVNYNKAQLQLKTIRDTYPKCGTLDPKKGINQDGKNKAWLDIIGEEIDFRQRIVATRQLLADAAIKAAERVKDEAQASKYRTVADAQLGILLDIIGNVPSMKLKRGELRIANKDYQGALRILYEVKNGESKNSSSDLYVKTSIQISKVFQLMGDGKSAADYAHWLITTAGPNSRVVQKHWPDIQEFLAWCYENGAKPLKKVEITTKVQYRPKTPDETEFAETVEPAYRVAAQRGQEVPAGVRWRHDFLKAKIEHFNEYMKLDRALAMHKGKPSEKEVLTADFTTRYETLAALNDKETKLWRLAKEIDEQIVRYGSIERLMEKKKDLIDKRDALGKEIKDLRAKLKSTPAVKIPEDAGAAPDAVPEKGEKAAKPEAESEPAAKKDEAVKK